MHNHEMLSVDGASINMGKRQSCKLLFPQSWRLSEGLLYLLLMIF
jgi:hypothetical protein